MGANTDYGQSKTWIKSLEFKTRYSFQVSLT